MAKKPQTKKKAVSKTQRLTAKEIKPLRAMVLEDREANRKGKNDPKVEEECNAQLREYNIAIGKGFLDVKVKVEEPEPVEVDPLA